MKEGKKGISLIVLVITIVVIIIIATVVILTLNENNPVGRAREATFKSDMKTIEEEFAMYVSNKSVESKGKFELETLNAGEDNIIYNTKEGDGGNIYEVIPSAKKKYEGEFEIIKGELYYKGSSEGKLIWAKEIGIKINPYVIIDGELMSANSNLLLLDSNGKVTIPVTVTKISTGVFNNLEGLKEVYIPGNVKEIGRNAFSNNKTLQKVVMEDGVEIIGDYAFDNCTSLVSVEMTDSVKSIGKRAFTNSGLSKIKLSNNITTIGMQAFYECINLKEVNIPISLNSLGTSLFSSCTSLEYIKIPANVVILADNVFGNCIKLNNIDVSENNNFVFEDNVIYSKDYKTLYQAVGKISKVIVKDEVETINPYAFYYIDLDELYISEKVKSISGTSIGNVKKLEVSENNNYFASYDNDLYSKDLKTLYRCNKTGSIKIKEGVENVVAGTFSYNITNIEFPDSLKSITGYNSIPSTVSSLYIPKNCSTIDSSSIIGIKQIEVDGNNQYYKVENGKYLLSKDGKNLLWVSKLAEDIEDIPNSIENILAYAFSNCNKLNLVRLNEGIKKIESNAFWYSNVSSIEIPSSIEIIGKQAFSGANYINSIKINKKKGEITGSPWGAVYGDRIISYSS